jgi:Xaa-Pro aminopeptidase
MMQAHGWDALVTVQPGTVNCVERVLVPNGHPVVLWIEHEAAPLLVTDSSSETVQAERAPFDSYSPRRPIDLPWREALAVLEHRLQDRQAPATVAVEKHTAPAALLEVIKRRFPACSVADAGPDLRRLRRIKDLDEVQVLRRLAAVAEAGYARARKILHPGISEVEVYVELQASMTAAACGPVETSGDYASGPRSLREGGPPTDRRLEAGDLYVLDLFPAKWGYQADLCRTIAVTTPSAVQREGWTIVAEALGRAEKLARPGAAARDVYREIKRFLDAYPLATGTFWHHLGHGVGSGGHEAPRLIPESDDILEAGDVICLEPGVYNPALQGGLRLENMYWVREHGIERLNHSALEL